MNEQKINKMLNIMEDNYRNMIMTAPEKLILQYKTSIDMIQKFKKIMEECK